MSVPGSSQFGQHGGVGQPCTFDYPEARPDPLDPESIVLVTVTETNGSWRFTEIDPEMFSDDELDDLNRWLMRVGDEQEAFLEYRTTLAESHRRFRVGCFNDTRSTTFNWIDVSADDAFWQISVQAAEMRAALQLIEPTVIDDRVVNTWNGLVVRSPAWLAIDPAAWTRQSSPPRQWMGFELRLLAHPAELEFDVIFTPKDGEGEPFSGTIACVESASGVEAGGGKFPAEPVNFPEWSQPGVTGPCGWTPSGKGQATITARATYRTALWVSGALDPMADYIWESPPVTYAVGELRAVNVND